ncbi:MAG: hypothetical protein KC645_10085 [Gemmatimonadetes bacterium]|nr:hypothetical protein [Gemmatimonadota bacterium]
MRRHALTGAFIAVGLAAVVAPTLTAQLHVAPEIVHSSRRNVGLGARVTWGLTSATWLYAEALEFLQDTDGAADPGVQVDASYRELDLGLMVLGDRRMLQPYAGAGGGFFYSALALELDGDRAAVDRTGWLGHLFFGLRVPRRSFTPYAEFRRVLNEGGQWVYGGGVAFQVR